MSEKIAIIGYSAQTGGANDAEELWNLIINDKSSIERLDDIDEAHVPYGSYIKSATKFDYEFFGYSYAEAKQMDPQHRLLLKHAWIALEMAGEANIKEKNKIGIFACCGINTYLLDNILSGNSFKVLDENPFSLIGNANDFLATRVAYKLNCKGPAITVQCGCSSSLVAIHMAKQSLLEHDSNLVIVGGVHLTDYEKKGYCYVEGGVTSNSGNCRAFEKNADGTVFSSGIGVIILKRLNDALRDRNTIYGTVEGSAVNNDGSDKGGFTAPSLNGQVALINDLLEKTSVDINDISYLETHGTATSLGDSIEYMALENVYKAHTDKRHFCKLGTLKNNIGHTDVSAGILGVIKVLKAFEHNIRPGMLNFYEANDSIELENSPFIFSHKHDEWPEGKKIAAISALGIGGTNAHIILSHSNQEKPAVFNNDEAFFLTSAKNEKALEKHIEKLSQHLSINFKQNSNACFSLNCGRKSFSYRASLRIGSNGNIVKRNICKKANDVIFGFPGQGTQYYGMAFGLYKSYAFFREIFDNVIGLFEKNGIQKLKEQIFLETGSSLYETLYTQPALFVTEYSIATFLINLGLKPVALLGHSLGEYPCYVISQMISLEDAVYLLSHRARLLNSLKDGGMISVNAELADIEDLAGRYCCDIAAKNAKNLFSVSGLRDGISNIQEELDRKNVIYKDIKTSAAFHSRYLSDVLQEFKNVCKHIEFRKGNIPLINNITGELIYEISSAYLIKHMESPVDFISVANTLKRKFQDSIVIELGPGRTISTLLRMNDVPATVKLLGSMKNYFEKTKSDSLVLSELLEDLWLNGVQIDFERFYEKQDLKKISLPTYAFCEHECYIKPKSEHRKEISKISEWFYNECFVPMQDFSAILDRQRTIKIDDIGEYKSEGEEHLVVELSDNIDMNSFMLMIELIKQYDERMKSVKRLDIVSRFPFNVYAAMYKSFARCLNQEMSFLRVRFLEVERDTNEALLNKIILSDIQNDYIKVLNNIIYRTDFVKAIKSKVAPSNRYKNVLIIGGYGKMSSYYANVLAEITDGKIILASRSLQKSEQITKLDLPKNFQEISSKLATCDADISDIQSMENCFKWIKNKFGFVDLIVHAAGVPQIDHVRRITDINIKYIDKVMQPKLLGLKNIDALQSKYNYKVIIVSSISSILGGIDLLVYSASHNAVDSFAAEKNWIVHNWDALQVESNKEESGLGNTLNSIAISDSSAVKALKQALKFGGSVIFSTIDLHDRANKWTSTDTLAKTDKEYSSRPTMRSIYVPPRTEIEQRMHDIWRDFLGFEQIGINDNFFELGGDSLQALQLVRKIVEQLQWNVKTVDLFEFPTIHALVTKYDNCISDTCDLDIQKRSEKRQQYLAKLKTKKKRGK